MAFIYNLERKTFEQNFQMLKAIKVDTPSFLNRPCLSFFTQEEVRKVNRDEYITSDYCDLANDMQFFGTSNGRLLLSKLTHKGICTSTIQKVNTENANKEFYIISNNSI